LLNAEAAKAEAAAALTGRLNDAGVSDYAKQEQNILKGPANAKGLDKLAADFTAIGQLQTLISVLEKIKDPTKILQDAIAGMKESLHGLGDAVETDGKKVEDFYRSIYDSTNALAKTNFADVASLLGVDKATIDAINTEADQKQKIVDAEEKINDYRKQAALEQDPQIRDLLLSQADEMQRQVDYATQIIPLLAQQKAVQESIQYTTAQTTLNSMGQSAIDKMLAQDLGLNKKGGRPNALTIFVDDEAKAILGDALKRTVKDFLDGMSGLKRPQSLEDIYTGYKSSVQLFGTFTKNFQDAVNQLVPTAQGGAAGGVFAGGSFTPLGGLGGASSGAGLAQNVADGIYGGGSSSASGSSATDFNAANAATAKYIPILGKAVTDASLTSGNGGSGGGGLGFSGGVGSIVNSILGPTGSAIFGGSGLAGMIGAISGVAGLGDMVGAAHGGMSSNKTWGTLGALGAALGAGAFFTGGMALTGATGILPFLMANPIVGIGAALIGAIAGGMFGNHETAAQEPDISDTTNYGTFVSDMNGVMGTFNGSHIGPSAAFNPAMGGTPLDSQIERYIQGLSNADIAKLTPQQQNAVLRLRAFPPGGLGIAGERQGIFTLADGVKIGVQDYENLIGLVQQAMGSTGSGGSLAPLISISAYGAGTGGYQANPYNTPGLNASEFSAISNPSQVGGSFADFPSTGNPYATPGIGGGGAGTYYGGTGSSGATLQSGSMTVNLVLDGRILAQVVTAYQNSDANRMNKLAA